MTREEYVAEYLSVVSRLGLKVELVKVSAGGALFMMGLRDSADDLDLDIPKEAWDVLAGEYEVSYFGDTPLVALPWARNADVHVDTTGEPGVMIDGVCCWPPHLLLKQKRELAALAWRTPEKVAKDLQDIAKLEAYIANQ